MNLEKNKAKNQLVVFVDYKLEWNPEFRSSKGKRDAEMTLAEMQQQRLSHQIYIWKANEEGLLKDVDNKGTRFKRVSGNESLSRSAIVKHIQELRATGYGVINLL